MMSQSARPATSGPTPRGEVQGATALVRERIAVAGRQLFLDQGFDRTTVEAIAERAGVARRTFFRYFRSKEDVLFADHDRVARTVAEHLAALDTTPALPAVCSGARLVLRSYVEDAEVSVQRYQLTRSVPALRERESAWVSRYNRLFAGYLRNRFEGLDDGTLMAEVAAAAVVAAHNHVLRRWLARGGEGDPMPEIDRAFAWVIARFGTVEPSASAADREAADGDDVVVAVFRAGEPLDDVMERISRSL